MYCPFSTDKEFIMKKLFVSFVLIAATMPVWEATQTVTLSVPGMTCAACPITVKNAISKVDGVSRVEEIFENSVAVVTFDTTTDSVSKLNQAYANTRSP